MATEQQTERAASPTVVANPFARATRKQARLRLALEGPAGYGKTFSALAIAVGLLEGDQRIAFADTESRSASKYAGIFDFDAIELDPPYHPRRFASAIRAAEANGYGVIILDSLSHAWTGEGGTLDIVDQLAKDKYRGDSHRAWKDGSEIQMELVEAMVRSKIHVIGCMRTKADYVREEREGPDGKTKTVIRKAGTKTIQRDEFDYEFDVIGRFDTVAVMTIVKSRYADLAPEAIVARPGKPFGETLRAWLSEGVPEPERPAAEAASIPDVALAHQGEPIGDAAERVITELLAVVDPKRKDEARKALAEMLKLDGVSPWSTFLAHGKVTVPKVIALLQQYDRAKHNGSGTEAKQEPTATP